MLHPVSSPPPPRNVEKPKSAPLALIRVTKASRVKPISPPGFSWNTPVVVGNRSRGVGLGGGVGLAVSSGVGLGLAVLSGVGRGAVESVQPVTYAFPPKSTAMSRPTSSLGPPR